MKVLLLDNYDSFTYNLAHYLEKLGCEVDVLRNDDPLLETIEWSLYDGLVLSPGPGLPQQSGQLMPVLKDRFGKMPILGVCLGMQALALNDGGALYNREGVMHGRSVALDVKHTGTLLKGIADFNVGLYHSWAVDRSLLSEDWTITATALKDQAPMIMEHSNSNTFGVQFHPESILTVQGLKMMENWVALLKS